MKGLFLKDLYLLRKYYKSYFVLAAVFLVISVFTVENPFFILYPIMLFGMLPIGMQQIDEKSKWDVFSGTLPCTRAQMVHEKYLFGLTFTLPAAVVTLGVQILRMRLTGGIRWEELEILTVLVFGLVFLMPSFSLPLIFKFGAARSRIVSFVIIGMFCGGSTLAAIWLDTPKVVELPSAVVVVLAIAVYILSWYLSVRFYEKREIP